MLRETDKRFMQAMFIGTAIILYWRGVWEGVGELPLLENPWVSLFVGAFLLTITGVLFSEQFDPFGGIEAGILKTLHHIHNHPKKEEFQLKYYDGVSKKEKIVEAQKIKHIEKNIIAFHEKDREVFIPIHRLRSIHRNNQIVWKL